MAKIREILDALEVIAPARYAFDFDRVGLQVGDPERIATKAVVSLDRSLAAAGFAKSQGAQLLLSHHPLLFHPLSSLDSRSHVGKTALFLAESGIAFIAAHTNWDSALGGVNDTLAGLLGLKNVRAIGGAAMVEHSKLVVGCPAGSEAKVIEAASEAGAGVLGRYDHCSFSSPGTGAFRPLEGANPAIGAVGLLETVSEIRVEMLVRTEFRARVDRAVRKAHPYEEPAIDWYPLHPIPEQPIGRFGEIEPTTLRDFVALAEKVLETRCWIWGDPNLVVRRVAVGGGAADEDWRGARNAGADVFLTGEVKQHIAVEAGESGLAMIAAGHYATEQPGCAALRNRLAEAIPDVEWVLFEPEPGQAGRPTTL